ncbi:hypothetical protein GOBAR_AA06448 [Gossypium barbadense]|uniref:Myb/SANT-like domain-containing protein n=1 Tax=Gossypium barbadense TaxID=3634 RepID=A0A2P5YEV1_GOSBA|nr:hypothetical protein GOBAR_AA06448 [Gossypium barbadense]
MSGFSQSSVSSQNSRGTKRKWVPEQDAALVACMVDLHNAGTFNADTGFKAGYLNELEKMLEKVLPNAMLKAKPNFESRIRTLKREWSIVYDMLSGKNNSGFGWDEPRKHVVAEDAVWNSYLNSHKEAAQFRHRSFPYYDQLTAIYAKDRATGKYAQIAADIIEEINAEDVTATNTHEERNDFHGSETDVSLDDMDLSATQLQPEPQPAKNQGLTEDEHYRALSKIPDHPTQMLIFFSLPSAVRLE